MFSYKNSTKLHIYDSLFCTYNFIVNQFSICFLCSLLMCLLKLSQPQLVPDTLSLFSLSYCTGRWLYGYQPAPCPESHCSHHFWTWMKHTLYADSTFPIDWRAMDTTQKFGGVNSLRDTLWPVVKRRLGSRAPQILSQVFLQMIYSKAPFQDSLSEGSG